MARVAGIQIDKATNGTIKKVTFDFKKHGEVLKPILENMGAIEEDDFEKKWREGITREELLKRVNKHIDTLPWKK
ncbi:MAG: thioredoxin domain-containing protein [Bacteroidia bacterium]